MTQYLTTILVLKTTADVHSLTPPRPHQPPTGGGEWILVSSSSLLVTTVLDSDGKTWLPIIQYMWTWMSLEGEKSADAKSPLLQTLRAVKALIRL